MTVSGSAKDFAADLQKFADQAGIEVRTIVGKLAFDIHRGLVQRTPVDTGRAKSNWIPTLDSPAEYVLEPDNAGRVNGMMANLINRLPKFPVVWITNNLPYIQRLNEGWSKKAPAGFVEVTVDSNIAKFRTKS